MTEHLFAIDDQFPDANLRHQATARFEWNFNRMSDSMEYLCLYFQLCRFTCAICCDRISLLYTKHKTIFIEFWNFLRHLAPINRLRSGQNGRHLTYLTDIVCILIEMSLKFVSVSASDNKSASFLRRSGDKLLSQPMIALFIDAYTHVHIWALSPPFVNGDDAIHMFGTRVRWVQATVKSALLKLMNIFLAANAFGYWIK